MSLSNNALKGTALLASIAGVTGSVCAQSYSTGSAQNLWNFQLDASSPGSDLAVTDLGLAKYNLINGSPGGYTYSADGGSAATVAVGYYYNPTNHTGFEGVYSSAQGDPGVATASLGDSESVLLTNTGTATDVVDVVSFLQSMITYVQPSPGYAVTLTTTAGMYIGTNYGTPNANLSEIYVQYTGNTGPGNPTGYNNFLTNVGYTALTPPPIVYAAAFDASLTLSIAPGETDFLSGFAESKNMVTPEPSAAMALGVGVLGFGLLSRRKRR